MDEHCPSIYEYSMNLGTGSTAVASSSTLWVLSRVVTCAPQLHTAHRSNWLQLQRSEYRLPHQHGSTLPALCVQQHNVSGSAGQWSGRAHSWRCAQCTTAAQCLPSHRCRIGSVQSTSRASRAATVHRKGNQSITQSIDRSIDRSINRLFAWLFVCLPF